TRSPRPVPACWSPSCTNCAVAVAASVSRQCVPAAVWGRRRSSRFRHRESCIGWRSTCLRRSSVSIVELVAVARGGSLRATGRLLSLVEGPRREEVLAVLEPAAARVVGVTGPPGAGKSTTVGALTGAYRAKG